MGDSGNVTSVKGRFRMKRFASLIAVLLLVAAVTAISAQEKEAPAADHCKMTAVDSETKVKLQKIKPLDLK